MTRFSELTVSRRLAHLALALSWITILFAAFGCYSKKPAQTTVVTAPEITMQHLSQNVAGGSFVVEPGQYKSFKLSIAAGMAKPRVEGTFSATGGNNDVEVFLLEENQFLNWQNSHKADMLYTSGRVTAEKLKVVLPEDPANYVLVFSNKFSIIRNKAVTANVTLQYDSTSAGQY
jgi:hypothetical protein